MKLYTKYKSIIEGMPNIEKAYFTTFNLSPEFFETYLLSPLLEVDIPDNDLSLEDLNLSLEESNIDIKVFYDASMLALNEKKRTLTRFYPVFMENGLFHPKVIYFESADKIVLFIGSGNLTLSGWGRNTEAFKIIEFEKKDYLKTQVNKFFSDVERLAGLRTNKSHIELNYDYDVNFIYSFETTNTPFLEQLNLDNNLYVWSPYFSDKLDQLLDHTYFDSLKQINIIPDLVGNDKIRASILPTNSKVKYYSNDKPNHIKMNHSKVWISDSKIAIGSYNFTKEALFGHNFEAAIIENIKGIKLSLDPIIPMVMSDSELLEESLDIDVKYKAVYQLTANWKDRNFCIEEISDKDFFNLRVVLPGNIKVDLQDMGEIKLDIHQTEKVFRALIKTKIFSIRCVDDIIFEGLTHEQNTCHFREPLKVETLDDVFSSFIDDKDPLGAKTLKNRVPNFENNIEEKLDFKTKTANYLNYYNLFRGFSNMRQQLDSITNYNEAQKYCFSSANALSSIIMVIEENKQEDLFTYIFIDELNKLINRVNKKLNIYDVSKIKRINNVDLNLQKSDIKFLKAFRWSV